MLYCVTARKFLSGNALRGFASHCRIECKLLGIVGVLPELVIYRIFDGISQKMLVFLMKVIILRNSLFLPASCIAGTRVI